jgi:hypothetical protein
MTDQYRNTHVLRIDGKGCHGEIVLHSLDAAHQINPEAYAAVDVGKSKGV